MEPRFGKLPQRGPSQEPVLPVRQPLPTCSGRHLAYQPSWGLKAPSLGLWGLNSIPVAFIGRHGRSGKGGGVRNTEFLRGFSLDNESHIPLPEKASARPPCLLLKLPP